MNFKSKWYSAENKPLEIPTFLDLQNVTGQVFDDFGNYIGKKDLPEQQLIINEATQRQYYAPIEYDDDAIRYARAKIDESFSPEEWYGMTRIKPHYMLGEHISAGYITALKSFAKPVAMLPTQLVYAGTVGLNYISQGNFESAENLYRFSMKNWEDTLDKYGLGNDPELRDMFTAKAGSVVGQTASSLLVASVVSSVGGLPAVAAVFGSTQFADIMEESLAKGLSHDKAVKVAFLSALSEGGLEAVGFRMWSRAASLNKSFRNLTLAFLWEGAQEGSQQIGESAITNFYGVREQKLSEIVGDVMLSFLIGGLVGFGGAAISGQVEQRNIALKKEVGMNEQGQIVTPKVAEQRKTNLPKEGQVLNPSPEARKQLYAQEIEEAKKTGDNKLYNTIKYVANANGITDVNVIDKLYPVCSEMINDGAVLENLLDIIGQQVVAYKNQLESGQTDTKATQKAVEEIKLATDPNRVDEWRESRKSELEKAGFTKEQAGVLSTQLSQWKNNLSQRLGFDITEKKPVSFEPNLQEKAGTRGQITLGKTIAKIALNKNADPTTVEHEFFHYVDSVVKDAAQEGNKEAQKLLKKRDSIIKEAKAELKKNGITKFPPDEEIIASAYEKWLWNGAKSEDATEQKLFEAIRDFFRDVYQSLRGLMGVRISPEADAYFRAMTGAPAETLYQFAGPRAETADRLQLSKAEQMLSEGKDAEEIRKETGWFKGADGKWRFEIEDGKINEEANLIENENNLVDDVTSYYYTTTLGELYDSPDLYKAYPELKNILVSFQALPYGNDGSYHRGTSFTDEMIVLSSEYLTKENPEFIKKIEEIKATKEYKKYQQAYAEEIKDGNIKEAIKKRDEADEEFYKTEVGKRYQDLMWGKNPPVARQIEGLSKDVKNTLIHEIQHAIQQREGFARGASTREFVSPKIRREITEAIQSRRKEAADKEFVKELENKAGDKETVKALLREEKSVQEAMQKYMENDITSEEAKEKESKFKELLSKIGITAPEYFQLKDKIERKHKAIRSVLEGSFDNIEIYKMVFGEIEARNAEKRSEFTKEQRKNISPESTQDIKSSDAIIVFEDGTELSFPSQNSETLYQGENKDLIATHATKLDNIDALLESGKLVAPSIAITKKGQKELNKGKFGQVVLVMNPLDIKYNADNIYNRDIYSPRFPSVQYKTELGYMSQSEYDSYKAKWDENQEDFKKKYGGTFDEVIGNDKYFFEGFNERTGNRIYKKYTPLNVLSYLKKESLVGGESFHYGLSSFLAKMSKKVEDRESLRKESKQLSDREESQKKYDELSKRYSDLLFGDINKYSKFSEVGEEDFDAFLKDLYEGHPERANEYLEVDKIPESLKKELKDFVSEAVSLPRSYFEMKPMRLIPLNNFVYAVTNKGNLSKEQIAKFESYGIEVKEVDDIKSFDFTSLEMGRENATNAFDVYFQQETQDQLFRNDQATKLGNKVLDKAPTNQEVEDELAIIQSGRVEKAQEAKRSLGIIEGLGDALITVRQRVGVIDKRLKYAFDKLDYNEKMMESEYGKRTLPFIKKYRKLSDVDKKVLNYLIGNQQTERIREFLRERDMEQEYNDVRNLLDELFEEGNRAGMDMGFLQEYFPTKVSDYKSFISYLMGTDKWSEIELALNQIDPNHQMSEEERADAINSILRGYNRLDPVGKKGFQKERKILHKTPEMMNYYMPADEALMRYVSGMTSALAIRKAFNVKGAFNSEESIGGVVDELIRSGKITHKEEAFIKKMLKARLNYARTAPIVSLLKNFGYLGTMNNITSAVTQIGDLYAAFYKYNFPTAMKAIFGKSEITKDDLYLDSIWEEFSQDGFTSVAVNKLFAAIGLNAFDKFGKNTAINGAWINLKERAKNNDVSLLEDLTAAFGSQAGKVLENIKNNNITSEVKLMLWSQLADTQPIGKSGTPVGYLSNGYARILYQLKTYTVNQLSLFYADGIYKIQKGLTTKNKKLFFQGTGNLMKLALLLTVFNAGADVLKNLIMGRSIEISDTLVSNLIWNLGVSKYTFYRGQRDGYARALFENFLPPQISMADEAYKDAKKIATGKKEVSDTIAVTYVPFGRMWYWWFGGGRTSEKKKGNKPFQVKL